MVFEILDNAILEACSFNYEVSAFKLGENILRKLEDEANERFPYKDRPHRYAAVCTYRGIPVSQLEDQIDGIQYTLTPQVK